MAHSQAQPLDMGFNIATMTIARRLMPMGWDSGHDAPKTFEELHKHFNRTNRIKVYDGACENTIFDCAEHNMAFRAWHDYHHLRLNAPFTLQGELEVMRAQQNDLIRLYGTPGAPMNAQPERVKRWCDIIEAEVKGQVEFYQEHGYFVRNQMQFVRKYLTKG